MRQDKEKIFELRRQGKSYRQIEGETGVSRATLSAWFKGLEWSKHATTINSFNSIEESRAHIVRLNASRKQKLAQEYERIELEATAQYQIYKNEPLFWAGLMAYAGEGDKHNKNLIRITNTEFYIHKIFVAFMETYLGVPKSRVKLALLLYSEHNDSLCREMWSNILGISRENFHKTQVLQGKERVKRLQYGIGMSILSSTGLKKKMLTWLSLAQDERFR